MKRKRIERPSWEEGDMRDAWGKSIRPPLPFSMGDVFQGFRDGLILKELIFLKCDICTKHFSILRRYCQQEVSCPYCNGVTTYIEDKGNFLFRLCAQLMGEWRVHWARQFAEKGVASANDELSKLEYRRRKK